MDHWNREMELVKERGKLVGSCFDGEPRRTACTELAGDDTVIPKEAWVEHGEEIEKMDTGIFDHDSHDPECRYIDRENLCEEDIYVDRYGDEEEMSQEEREAKRRDPKAMLTAAKSLLRMLYGLADDSISIFEFEGITKTNSIIVIYLRERMDGVVKHFFKNLRDEHITETVLDFVRKMVPYKPAVSREEENHILPHARIERFECEAAIRRISSNSEISGEMKRRLINQASWEGSRHNNGNHLAIRLGEAIFGKSRFNRMLRSTAV